MSAASVVIRSVPERAVLGAATTALVVVLLQVLVARGVIAERYFPAPSAIFGELVSLTATTAFWFDVGATLQGWAAGLAGAALIAIPLGLLIGSIPSLFHATRLVIEFLRPVPSVALVPAVVLLLGVGFKAKVFLAIFGSMWPLFVNTIYGIRAIDRLKLETARSFRLSRTRQVISVILPAALPYIVTGARIASSIALILSVTAELIIGMPGLGRSINIAQAGGAVAEMYALILTTGLLGVFINIAFRALERLLLHWHQEFRA